MKQYRGKRVDNGEWVKGCLFKYKYSEKVFIVLNEYSADELRRDTTLFSSGYAWYEVIPETVGQSIGLVDRNNKEMYFNDTVLWNGKKWVIIWNKTCLGIYLQPLDNYYEKQKNPKIGRLIENLMYGRAVYLEVIGNIHENPDLLEGDSK